MKNNSSDDFKSFGFHQSRCVRLSALIGRSRLRVITRHLEGYHDNFSKCGTEEWIQNLVFRWLNDVEHCSVEVSNLVTEKVIDILEKNGLAKAWKSFRSDNTVTQRLAERWIESPLEFCSKFWSDSFRENDIQFFYSRSVVGEYKVRYGSELAQSFYQVGASLNRIIEKYFDNEDSAGLNFVSEILDPLSCVSDTNVIEAYLEMCFSSNYFSIYQVATKQSFCVVKPRGLSDPEFILSRLFSIPTASSGLNQIFGGSGPMFNIRDNVTGTQVISECPGTMPGRVVVVRGRHGVGKSVFGLFLASEVASKGGVVWYFSTEQSIEEVLYTLKTVSASSIGRIKVISSATNAFDFLVRERDPDEGVLLVLALNDASTDKVWRYLKKSFELRDKNKAKDSYRLDLAVIDSLNGIPHSVGEDNDSRNVSESKNLSTTTSSVGSSHHSLSFRKTLLSGLEDCTHNGMNLILLEEANHQAPENDYEAIRSLADCVIELTVEHPSVANSHGYARRYLEILKSRLQRDQRGRHAFSIIAPQGVVVTPSPAAVRARLGSRRLESRETDESFGLPSLDEILEDTKFRSSELNVIIGGPGTFKTELTAAFLAEQNADNLKRSRKNRLALFVTMRMSGGDYRKPLESVCNIKPNETAEDYIRFCRLPVGFVTPAEVLKAIEAEYSYARNSGRTIARVVLDEIGDWGRFSPFIQDDATFESVLLDFFLRRRSLVLATLSTNDTTIPNRIQKFFVENASRLIELQRFNYSGRQRALLRVIQTPRMNHKRDAFELKMDDYGKLTLDSRPSLFEVANSEVKSTAGLRLYLQTESLQQQQYNKRIRDQLCSMLTTNVEIHSQDHLSGVAEFTGLGLSVLNNLQVMQIDGFRLVQQASRDRSKIPKLHPLELHGYSKLTKGSHVNTCFAERYLERLRRRMFYNDDLVAVPYYDNISFLVLDRQKLINAELKPGELTWEQIAEQCDRNCNKNSSEKLDIPFFDFPQGSQENFNTLFLEILFNKRNASSLVSINDFADLINGTEGVEAIDLFYRIARPAYLYHLRWMRCSDSFMKSDMDFQFPGGPGPTRYYVCANSTVWRHWFTTYNQMMSYGGIAIDEHASRALVENPDEICLRSLPGGLTTTGEWYLSIPKHCAVPSAGNSVLELLINEEADRERFDLGVGLPVHESAYRNCSLSNDSYSDSQASFRVVPSTDLTIQFFQELRAEPKIERGCLAKYQRYSSFLCSWLQRLLRVPTLDALGTRNALMDAFNSHFSEYRK
jgi:KaiC/GvpD/RAD55 family RecA-like ATPase